MKKLMLTVATAALGLGMALPGQAQTVDADCQKMFEAADTNKDGSLGIGENDKFVVLMSTKPKDASVVTMEEFLAECRKDAFKGIQEAAVAPAPDTNTAMKSSSDATTATSEQPAATASQDATTTQPATTDQSATAEQPAATASQDATTTQPTTTDQSVTAEQPAATASQDATTTQPTTTDQSATVEQSAVASQDATVTEPTATDQPATVDQPAIADANAAAQTRPDMLASKLIGTKVVSIDNKDIGEINDIVIDVETEQAAQAIIGVGGFLGIGEKNVAVDLKRLDVRTDINSKSWTIVLDTTEDELKQLPEYQAAAN